MSFVATWLDFNTSKPGPTGSIEGDPLLWLEVGLLRDPEGVIQAGGLGSAAVRLRCFQRAFAFHDMFEQTFGSVHVFCLRFSCRRSSPAALVIAPSAVQRSNRHGCSSHTGDDHRRRNEVGVTQRRRGRGNGRDVWLDDDVFFSAFCCLGC